MGMYTEIRFKGRIKEKFVDAFKKGLDEPYEFFEGSVTENTYWTKQRGVWYRCNEIEHHPELEDMGLAHRSDESFFGECIIDGNNVLIIDNEFKNYHGETRLFKKLLNILFDKVYFYQTRYEECDEWTDELKGDENETNRI